MNINCYWRSIYLKKLFQFCRLCNIECYEKIIMNDKYIKIWKQTIVAYVTVLSRNFVECLRKITKDLGQVRRELCRNSNQVLPDTRYIRYHVNHPI
jgi:hypothetical protein